jgi:hypothetical protein
MLNSLVDWSGDRSGTLFQRNLINRCTAPPLASGGWSLVGALPPWAHVMGPNEPLSTLKSIVQDLVISRECQEFSSNIPVGDGDGA